jgi:hypothetical protein
MCLNIEIASALKFVCADLSDKFIQRQMLDHSRQGEKRKACANYGRQWTTFAREDRSLFVLPISYRNIIRSTRSSLLVHLALSQLPPS